MTFKELGLLDELLKAVDVAGYTNPTPIQEQAIPLILQGHDLLAGSQTGTGKTASFTLPLLQRLMANMQGQPTLRALILAPTRELAAQVLEDIRTYGKFLPLRAQAVFGGVNIMMQAKQLRNGVDILVATPGRLLDLVRQKKIDLSRIETLVLDEADRMLDMGFIHDIRTIVSMTPKNRQTLLFSATFSSEIKALAANFLRQPKSIETVRHNTPTELVKQKIHPVDNKRKRELLSHLITSENWQQVLVFTRTKHCANRLAEDLREEGISAAGFHGNKTQAARTKALAGFKEGKVRILVATDIAARGIDIDHLPHVVNFELPNVPEDYVHRIGRTGRAGNKGEAISLVSVDEHKFLRDIESLLKQKIENVIVPGFEPNPAIKAQPIFLGRGGGGGGGQQFRGGGGGGSSRGAPRPNGKLHSSRGKPQYSNRSR